MLRRLVESTRGQVVVPRIVSLVGEGPVAAELRELGIPVLSLDMMSSFAAYRALRILRSVFLQDRPDVVQTWMYHADLLGGMAACMAGRVPVVWNIRHSDLRSDIDSRRTRVVARICAKLSRRLPSEIVVNSECGRQWHERFGYDASKLRLIPNAFDVARFGSRSTARR
ncbi:MAG: glycosyltransferase, partial [Pirellulales bacterium]|nr:glycosyltransferase [Pirellulales bacterium]